MAAAMVGGTAYVAGKAGARKANEQAADQQAEYDQEQRIAQLEAQQQQQAYAAPPPPQPYPPQQQYAPPPAAPAVPDLATKIGELKALMDQGVLTPAEFEQAKQKLLAG
jgi:hypothetical protein